MDEKIGYVVVCACTGSLRDSEVIAVKHNW